MSSGGELKPNQIDLLLSRPILSRDAQIYRDAWRTLSNEQPIVAAPAGMSGFLLANQKITRRGARREGRDLGFEGDALHDFIDAVLAIDAMEWPENIARQSRRIARMQKKNESSG